MGSSLRAVCLWPRKQHVVKYFNEIDCLVIFSQKIQCLQSSVSNLEKLLVYQGTLRSWPRMIPKLVSRTSYFDKCCIYLINKDSQCFLKWTVSTKWEGYVNGDWILNFVLIDKKDIAANVVSHYQNCKSTQKDSLQIIIFTYENFFVVAPENAFESPDQTNPTSTRYYFLGRDMSI